MAQPAREPVKGSCSTPPAHTEDAVTSVHPVDEKLHPSRLVPARYAGVATPPLIAGVATILRTIGVKNAVGNRLPFVNAASSAGIAPILAIAETNDPGRQLPAVHGAPVAALPAPFASGAPGFQPAAILSHISAGALVAVTLNLFFHHLGTRGRQPAPALKSS